jgi:hypothetical protein
MRARAGGAACPVARYPMVQSAQRVISIYPEREMCETARRHREKIEEGLTLGEHGSSTSTRFVLADLRRGPRGESVVAQAMNETPRSTVMTFGCPCPRATSGPPASPAEPLFTSRGTKRIRDPPRDRLARGHQRRRSGGRSARGIRGVRPRRCTCLPVFRLTIPSPPSTIPRRRYKECWPATTSLTSGEPTVVNDATDAKRTLHDRLRRSGASEPSGYGLA